MDSDASGGPAVIEVRTYQAREGQRERQIALMRELAFPVHRALGIRVLGPFPSVDDTVGLVWLRAYPSAASRETLSRAFYESQEWTLELEGQLMPLIERYSAIRVEDRDGLWQRWPGRLVRESLALPVGQ
jgi:hypothetical protein